MVVNNNVVFQEQEQDYLISIKKDDFGFYYIEVQNVNTGEIIFRQETDPRTNDRITTEEQAKQLLLYVFQNVLGDLYTVYLDLSIKVFDETLNQYVKKSFAKIGDKVKIEFTLYKEDKLGNREQLPLNGKYIVPYLRRFGTLKNIFSEKFLLPFLKYLETTSNTQLEINKQEILNQDVSVLEGAVLIEVQNGRGSYETVMKKSGFFLVDPDLIINVETMKPVQPKPKTKGDIYFIVVE
jgi:hypothetical protein